LLKYDLSGQFLYRKLDALLQILLGFQLSHTDNKVILDKVWFLSLFFDHLSLYLQDMNVLGSNSTFLLHQSIVTNYDQEKQFFFFSYYCKQPFFRYIISIFDN